MRRIDRARLKALAEASKTWQPYMRAELGVKAPSSVERWFKSFEPVSIIMHQRALPKDKQP